MTEIGRPSRAELRALLDVVSRALGWEDAASPIYQRRFVRRVGAANFRVARTKGSVAGGLLLYRMGQWFGGRRVPMVGVAAVGVAPEHRSRGVASRLMRAAMEEAAADGTPLSCLYPATQPVYRRVGFEHAGTYIAYQLPTKTIDVRDRELELRAATPADHARMRALYAERARRTAGNLDRAPALWERVFKPLRGASRAFLVLRDGRPEGYVVYDQEKTETVHYDLLVRDLVVLTPQAGRRLLTFFADHRSFSDLVKFGGGPSMPLLVLPAEQECRVARAMRWMLRIVDVRRALEARGYAAGVQAEAHLEVRDDVLPRNQGRFVVDVADGKARVRPGGRGAVRIDVRGLAALYSGYLSPQELRATGYVDGPERELDRLAPVFAGPAPWMPEIF